MTTRTLKTLLSFLTVMLFAGCSTLEPDPALPASLPSEGATARSSDNELITATPETYHFGTLWLWEQDTIDWLFENIGGTDLEITNYFQIIYVSGYPHRGSFTIDYEALSMTHMDGSPIGDTPPHSFLAGEQWLARPVIVPERLGELGAWDPSLPSETPYVLIRAYLVYQGDGGQVLFTIKDLLITGDASVPWYLVC